VRATFRAAFATERMLGIRKYGEMPPANRLLRAWAANGFSTFLEFSDQLVRATGESRARTLEIEQELTRRLRSGWTPVAPRSLRSASMEIWTIRDASDRAVPRCRCLRIINEWRERSLASPRLQDLRLPAEAKVDPFNDEPIRLVARNGGLLVYSVDANLKDD